MSESKKTGIFAAVAGLLAIVSWFTFPRAGSDIDSVDNRIGKPLFANYDPSEASSLKIVKFNTEEAKREDFEVTRDKASNLWTIPSRYGYPADATKQMSEAANAFLNVTVLGVATDKRDEHKLFGVLEPDEEKVGVGDEGVGMMVRMKDAKNDDMVYLIVGKTEKDQPKHRFVRVPSQDRVYLVEIDIDSLSTDFSRWIESDLLKLSSNDIQTLGIRDYTIVQTAEGGQLNPNFDADVSFSTTDGKWSADKIVIHDGPKDSDRVLTADEKLNGTKLNEIKNALDSLRIVDVYRKPKGLATDFKVEKTLLDDRDSILALFRRGFIPQKGSDGNTEIFATSGELLVTLKDGVQYMIRFGNTTGESTDGKEQKEGEPPSDSLMLDRYMLVSARLDDTKYPAPSLKTLPETYDDVLHLEAAETGDLPEAEPVDQSKLDAMPAEDNSAIEVPPAPEPESAKSGDSDNTPVPDGETDTGAPDKPEGGDSETKKEDELTEAMGPAESRLVRFQPPAEGSDGDATPSSEASSGEPASGTNQPPENPTSNEDQDTKSAEPKSDGTQPPAANPESEKDTSAKEPPKELTEEEKKEKLEAARERITKENQRVIDEHNEKLETAKNRVMELNARFADWFYVISESEYKKLRIQLNELIQPAGAADAPAGGGLTPGFSSPPGLGPTR